MDPALPAAGWFGPGSEQLTKLVRSESSIFSDASHGECVNWIMPWYRQNPPSVGQDGVLAFTNDFKTNLSECPDGLRMADAGNLGHVYTVTVTERTSSPFSFSCRTSRYSRIAIRIL